MDRQPHRFLRKVIWGAAALLGLLVLLATQLTTEVNATEAIAYLVLFSAAAGAVELALALRARTPAYRIAVGVALGGILLLGWVNGAVGIIGNEDQPANLLYLGVILVGLIGALVARFQSGGVSRALLAMAIAQAIVPVVAMVIWPRLSWGAAGIFGVFVLNAAFAGVFVVASWLFRRIANGEHAAAFQ